MRAERALLLDLDGVLVDPGPGILGSCRHALESLGAPAAEDDDLAWMIGPPLRASFGRLLGPGGDVEAALRLYRERYAAWGLYQAEPYAGVDEALATLRDAGFELLLCTSKAAVFARQVVAHFGLARHLDGIYGAELDGRFDDKGELIGHLLRTETRAAASVCMIGDREHDVLGAARNGVRAIGVLWGYGSRAELTAAGAYALADAPGDLARLAADAFA